MDMESNNRVDEQGEVNVNVINPLSSHGSSDSNSSSTSSSVEDDLFGFDGNNDTKDHRIENSGTKSRRTPKVSIPSSTTTSSSRNRIPSSVFSGKPAPGTDWSETSNESLFSIQIGNSSFSKDQYFMLYKSGELTKLDEQIIAQKNALPTLKELDDMAAMDANKPHAGSGHDQASPAKTGDAASTTEEVPVNHGTLVENISLENKHTGAVHNVPLNKTASIDVSFTFPVLTSADGGRLSSAQADQNKGIAAPLSNQQQPPLPQKIPEEEEQREKENTEENEPQNPDVTGTGESRSWFSCFSCCRRS